MSEAPLKSASGNTFTGVPHSQEDASTQDPTRGLCKGSSGGPSGWGCFSWARYPPNLNLDPCPYMVIGRTLIRPAGTFLRHFPVGRGENDLKGFITFKLKAKDRIWP